MLGWMARNAVRWRVKTFIAVADAVSQQLASHFAEQQVAFMAQLWHFTPRSLLEGQKDVKTGDVADTCEMYGADADEVCRELSDFKLVYRLSGLKLSSELPVQWKNVTILSIKNQRVMMTLLTTKIVKTCK